MLTQGGMFGKKGTEKGSGQTEEKETTSSLSCDQRPKEVKDAIDSAFNALKYQTSCGWGLCNGRNKESYQIAGINEYQLIKQLILNNPDRSDFYMLDIGAGEFGFSNGLAQLLNNDKDLKSRKDIKIHIIGLRGETYKGPRDVSEGICQLHNLGAFPVENMLEEFKQLNMDFAGKIDVAVSNSSFKHFIDPVGTFLQTHKLLRPETGLFLLDGFYYECDNLKADGDEAYFGNILQLFFLTGEAFLFQGCTFAGTLNHFIMRKGAEELSLPLSYKKIESRDPGKDSQHYVCVFHSDSDVPNKEFNYEEVRPLSMGTYTGDPELFSFLNGHKLLADCGYGARKKVKYTGPFQGVLKKAAIDVPREEPSASKLPFPK